jgi:hypothetical protein
MKVYIFLILFVFFVVNCFSWLNGCWLRPWHVVVSALATGLYVALDDIIK